jgi:serine/threonine-protein kinase
VKVVRRGSPRRERATEVIEEGRTPPERPPIGPWLDRDLWPWLFVLLVLVVGGIVAAVLLTRDDKKTTQPTTTVVATTPVQTVTTTTPATTTGQATVPVAGRVQVANVVGVAAPTALKRLQDQGLQPAVHSVFSTKPRGVVVAQSPGAGSQIAKGATVTLSVSKGQASKPVPDTVGQSEADALSLLKAAGFDPDVQRVPSNEPAGTVVAQKPRAGEKAASGTHVLLNVSSGPKGSSTPATTAPAATTPAKTTTAQTTRPAQPANVTVPDVERKTLQQAVLALRQAGMYADVRYVPSEESAGTVVGQAKDSGSTAKRGDHVLVTVSQGNDPNAVTATLPNVEGQAEQAAGSRLRSAGFVPLVGCLAPANPAQVGKVVDEQPGAGTQAPKGVQILIYVGRRSCG